MKLKRIKPFAAALVVLPIVALMIFNTGSAGTIVRADTEAAETYKKQCAMCHSPKAEKLFDPTKKDEAQVEVILKGKKAEKPPHMPGYESKGINAAQAQALVDYMKSLRKENEKQADAKEEAKEETEEKSREATVAYYKANCTVCHGAKADKLYDPKKNESELAQIILKGKKGEKPPHMPAYEPKGVTEKQAKALVAYMTELRTPGN